MDGGSEIGSESEYDQFTEFDPPQLGPNLVRRISREEETEMRQELRILTRRHSVSLCDLDLDGMNSENESGNESAYSESEASTISVLSGGDSDEVSDSERHLLRE